MSSPVTSAASVLKEPHPPPLDYSLHTRKLTITLFWSLVVIDSVFMPIALYFGLQYGTSLDDNAVLSITMAALGGVSLIEYIYRTWRLVNRKSDCRCSGAKRHHRTTTDQALIQQLDWFHWCFTLMWVFVLAELIYGTTPTLPPMRLLSMPLATVLYTFGTIMLVVDAMRYLRITIPFPLSSQPRGSVPRPAIYPYIEDIVAVDGGGGATYRKQLSDRYEASPIFRAMLSKLSLFWWIGAELVATLTTALVFTLPKEPAYVVGWSLPFLWAGIWTAATIWYAKRELRREAKQWSEEVDLGR
ncbi:hypothetical protein JCM24511_07285 [Saitozyma sp. JCM 24511]|nr:hypothetical protein JCM24511_07285 [Saitozyma sp. JCM 24511]